MKNSLNSAQDSRQMFFLVLLVLFCIGLLFVSQLIYEVQDSFFSQKCLFILKCIIFQIKFLQQNCCNRNALGNVLFIL